MGNLHSSEGVHLRFLDECPKIPPAPMEDQVQLRFDELLLSVCANQELRDELNTIESIDTKWAYVVLNKLSPGSIAEDWLNPRECVELLQRFRGDVQPVHDLVLALRISIMLRPSEWVKKFVLEKGIKELMAPLQVSCGSSVETCNKVLSTLFVLANNSIGIQALLKIPECCPLLCSIFDSSTSSEVKVRSLKLLGMLCCESTIAQDEVMSAFSAKSPEDQSLQSLVSKIKDNQSDIALLFGAVKFVNTLLETTRDRKQRKSFCEDLKTNGFIALLEPFKNRNGDATTDSPLTLSMIAQVDIFFESYSETTKGDNLGALRLALGDALNANRNSSGRSGQILKGDITASNQGENDASGNLKLEQQSTSGVSLSPGDRIPTNVQSKVNSTITNTNLTAEGPSLDNIFNQLQQHTKNLDQETNDKLTNLLQKIVLTLSDNSAASKAVDHLDKSLSLAQNPNEVQVEPGANMKDPIVEAKPTQEPDLLTRVGMALFPSLGESASSLIKPPTAGRPPLFSGFGDFSLPSLTATTPAKSSITRPSLTSFIGADSAANSLGRSTDSPAARGVKLSLPFFQSSRKGPGLGVTPACTPIATASVRKDAKRPVFPSFPSPPRKEIATTTPPASQTTPATPLTETVIPPPSPSIPPIDIAPEIPPLEAVKPLVIEQDTANNFNVVHPLATGTDISKFRKLLSMGAPREAVRAKMQQAGVDPDLLDEQQGFTPKASPKPTSSVEKATPGSTNEVIVGPDVSKFRKLLSMGAPLEVVKAKMSQAGLDPSLLDQKTASVEVKEPNLTSPPQPEASSDPDISKFKKLLSMGAPLAAVKAKMTQAGLDPALLDGPSSTAPPATSVHSSPPAKLKVKDDPSYAKFFKLLSMGAPAAAVKAKMLQAGLNSELLDTPDADMPTTGASSESTSVAPEAPSNPQVLLSNMTTSHAVPQHEPQVMVKDDPQYAKFFKLLSMGAPADSVKAKMRMAGLQPELLDTPDAPLRLESSTSAPVTTQPALKVKEDPAYAKFFKLLSMGAPTESVKAKMRMAGLNPDLLDTPDASVPSVNAPVVAAKEAVKVKDDPSYAKFFKLLSMGAPAESVKTKMQMAGLKPELLDTPDAELSSENTQAASQPQVKVKDDPAYAKFFKLLEMGAPAESVKTKMKMAGLQGNLLDTPDAFLPRTAPATQAAPPAPTTTAARRAHLSIAIKPAIKAKTRSFYWQHLKAEAIKGTIWAEIEKEHSNQSNQDLLTLTESELELLETEFPPPTTCGPGTARRGGMNGISSPGGPASPLASPRVVFLIDRARSNNISIIVKQFRMSNAALRVAIMKMDSEVLTLDRVQGLIKILPTEEEIAAIVGFSGDPMTLNGAELVLKELITVPRLKQRLSALETKHQFPALVRDLQTKINKIRVASNEIAQSSELKIILLVILQVGNKMNQGTARGGAKGFRLNDLTKLVQLKSADKAVTLLHYVARMIRMKKGNVVRLGDSLASLYDVQSIPIPELPGDMNRINDLTESINVELAAQRLKNRIEEKEESDLFVESMTVFVDEASKEVTTLKKDLDETLRLMRDTMIRFDKNTDEEEAPAPASDAPITPAVLTGAGEFFSIIYEFTMSLTKADRENELKRIRDEKRLKQQELKNATPRRNAVDRVSRTKSTEKTAGPEMDEAPTHKSTIGVSSGQSGGAASLDSGASNNPVMDLESSVPHHTEADKSKVMSTNAARIAEQSQPQTNVDAVLEEKAETKPSGVPKTGLKIPGMNIKNSSLPNAEASPLKKVIGTKPTGIPSPMKINHTNSLASATPAVPFDAASLSEIKSQLKTKHATNNEPQVMRGLKPEVEAEGDDDNNNNEPSSPEKTRSQTEA